MLRAAATGLKDSITPFSRGRGAGQTVLVPTRRSKLAMIRVLLYKFCKETVPRLLFSSKIARLQFGMFVNFQHKELAWPFAKEKYSVLGKSEMRQAIIGEQNQRILSHDINN